MRPRHSRRLAFLSARLQVALHADVPSISSPVRCSKRLVSLCRPACLPRAILLRWIGFPAGTGVWSQLPRRAAHPRHVSGLGADADRRGSRDWFARRGASHVAVAFEFPACELAPVLLPFQHLGSREDVVHFRPQCLADDGIPLQLLQGLVQAGRQHGHAQLL